MISTSQITMRFGKTPLFEDVSVKFTPGNRYGLIGANGSGKSTFMKILTGQLQQTEGVVNIGPGCRLGYLRQDHSEFDEYSIIDTVYMGNPTLWKLYCEREQLYSKGELSDAENERCAHIEDEFGMAGGYMMETEAATLLTGLGFTDDLFNQSMTTLQGGFKLRVLLAQVLFGQPEVLLLDEPTNHLDMESIEWLVELLKQYEGTLLAISHDRYFLNQVCTNIADLDYHEMRMFRGNYDDFTIASLEARELQNKSNKKLEKQASHLKAFIARFSSNASKAKQATSRKKTLEKMDVQKVKASSRVSPYIRFEAKKRLSDNVIEVKDISKTYDETLFNNFTCSISSKERIAIIGKNGIGKTTLLHILCDKLKSDTGQVQLGETVELGLFPQDASTVLKLDETAIGWLSRFAEPGSTEVDIRAFMGRMLFRGEDCFKTAGVLSGGEKARLIISKLTMEGANVLAFDEPTNHLDLESIESLNYALSLFPNTLLFVSHDHRFIASLATRIFEVTETGIIDYHGTLDAYEADKLRKKREEASLL